MQIKQKKKKSSVSIVMSRRSRKNKNKIEEDTEFVGAFSSHCIEN
jgi:hypothetical protein